MRRVWLIAGIVLVVVGDVALVVGATRLFKVVQQEFDYAEPIEVRPILIGEKATTQREFRQLVLSHNLRTMVDAYQEVGVRDPSWDEAALRLLRGYAAAFAEVTDQPTKEALLADAKRALAAGCSDPLVLYCCGVAFQDHSDLEQAHDLLARSLESLQKSRYPRIRPAFAALRLACLSEQLGKKSEINYWQIARSLLMEAATDGGYRPGEERVLLSHLNGYLEEMPAAVRKGLYEDLRTAKQLDPYVADVFGGWVEMDAAWEARSSDWAAEVSKKQWQEFREHLAEARRLLTQAWKEHPEYPEAPAEMVRISSGLDGYNDETRLWFDRTVAAEADFQPAYKNLLWFMRPRWGGGHEEMYQFGVQCLRTKRFDTEVPLWFVKALVEITDDLEDDKEYWLRPETTKHLRTLFEGYTNSKT